MVFLENLETCTNIIMEETVFKMNVTHCLRKTLCMKYIGNGLYHFCQIIIKFKVILEFDFTEI